MNHEILDRTSIILYSTMSEILDKNEPVLSTELFHIFFNFRDDIFDYFKTLYYEDDEYNLGVVSYMNSYSGRLHVRFDDNNQIISIRDLKETSFHKRK